MSVVLLLSERNHETYATPRHVGLRDRIMTRAHRFALDRALAEGASPESSPALALRAQQLLRPTVRRQLGQQIETALRDARRPPFVTRTAPIPGHAVRDSDGQLERLAMRLLDDRPLAVRGIAHVRTLLCDGTSPLYSASDPEALRAALDAATDALEHYS